jgi:teichuronic acid exporter
MLKSKAKSAVLWSSLDNFMRPGIGIVVTIILARLLVPEDFGTLALLALFLAIAGLFMDAGFSAALIQRQDVTHVDESTVFWFNIAAALIIMLFLFAASPWISEFFEVPVLQPLTILMAGNVGLSAIGAIHSTLLTKRLDFKTQMKVGVISTIVSGSVGVYMAWAGYGVWALAWHWVVNTAVGTLLLWFFCSWRPLFEFSGESFKRLFGFSSWVFGAQLINVIYLKGYTLLIGKFYSTYDLGIYNRADDTQQLPTTILTGIVSNVAFPLFSSINSDKQRLRQGVRLSIRSITLITSPVMVGLGVLAEPFLRVVFGEQWLPAAPILQVLCVVGLLWPLQVINLNVLQAQGYANLLFRLEVIKKSSGIVLLVIGSFFGIMGIAWSRVIQSIIALLINGHYTKKLLGYSVSQQTTDCSPNILLSAAMGAVVFLANVWIEIGGILEFLILIMIGALFYLASNILLGITAFKEVVSFVLGKGSS